ncbi:MAG TPA: HEAT repeat domain-containing protein [Acidobacteriota bacterium]
MVRSFRLQITLGLLFFGLLTVLRWSGFASSTLTSPSGSAIVESISHQPGLLMNYPGKEARPEARASRPSAGVVSLVNIRDRLSRRAEHALPGLDPGRVYSLSLSVDSPRNFRPEDRLSVVLRDARSELARKVLHLGDPDIYLTFRPTIAGLGTLMLEAKADRLQTAAVADRTARLPYTVKVLEWRLTGSEGSRGNPLRQDPSVGNGLGVEIETEPNNTWEQANLIHLGTTVFATADDDPYIPVPEGRERQAMERGEDWFRFEFAGQKPQLAFFNIDLDERDNIPCDVSVYRIENGRLHPYEDGTDPVTPPHEVQAINGNKFTSRVLRQKGTYYVRVLAHHPSYQLRTAVYDLPPYQDPRQAVRTAVDYIIDAGDSWHANTPRKGGIYSRVANVHQETSECVACHPTHFSLRAQLYALQNGYPVRERPQVQFLTERFYNNPRPFYGHPGASWSRMISAPANVLSRMAALLNIYEREVSGERRDEFFQGVGGYLKLYYRDRNHLPPDESNGNTPIVSRYEVAWYSWVTMDELYRRTGDKSWLQYREQLRRLLEETDHRNMLDLCYQTLALSSIDRDGYRDRIRQNCEKIFSHQRANGQWAMNFESDAPEAEFQTGHCLWVLATAGYGPEDSRIAKAVAYLLKRQQPFGGWFDPQQPYENFRTPFRETQMAILALSTLYKGSEPAKVPGDTPRLEGENSKLGIRSSKPASRWGQAFEPPPARLDFSRVDRLLRELNNIWDPPPRRLMTDVMAAATHDDVLVRQAAIACLGRVGDASSIAPLKLALGDPSKIVQRAAAWALRQLASRKQLGDEAIRTALSDKSDRMRWGATRIFATHFSSLARRPGIAASLLRRVDDPVVTVRMQALKGLWQLWYWNDSAKIRDRVEAIFISRLGRSQHPWVRRNLKEGLYNIADENIRYLYNNWVPLLGMRQDRERAILARLATERRLADKAALALTTGNSLQREGVLRGLSEFHLRSPDSYDQAMTGPPRAKSNQTLYVRIGNDIETIQFFGESARVMAHALLPLVDSPDAETRRLATRAGFVLREVPMQKNYAGQPAATRQSSANGDARAPRPGREKSASYETSDIRDVVRLAEKPKSHHASARQRLASAIYRRLADPDSQVRAAAAEVYKSFTLDVGNQPATARQLLAELLASPYAEARLAALKTIAAAGPALGRLAEPAGQQRQSADAGTGSCGSLALQVKQYIVSAETETSLAALAAVQSIPSLHRDADVLRRVNRALSSRDSKTLRVAIELTVRAPDIGRDLAVSESLDRIFSTRDSKIRKTLLDSIGEDRGLLEDRRVLSLVSEALLDPDPAVAGAAIGIVRRESSLQRDPAVLVALDELRASPEAPSATRFIADSLYRGGDPGRGEAAERRSSRSIAADARFLDFAYFLARVQPIFEAPGRDGKACVDCHASHAILRLNPPDPDVGYTEAKLRENYRSALRVVDLLEPERSLILRKPTSSSETEGVVGADRIAHGGGVRWNKDSQEYRTLLEWIHGAKLVSWRTPFQ